MPHALPVLSLSKDALSEFTDNGPLTTDMKCLVHLSNNLLKLIFPEY